MLVVVTGISHKTAPLELRERLALDEEAALRLGRALLDSGAACEAVALSTCNRTELYMYAGDSLAARQAAVARLAAEAGVSATELEPCLYSYSGDGAIAQLSASPPASTPWWSARPRSWPSSKPPTSSPARAAAPAWCSTGSSGMRSKPASAYPPRPPSASAP